MDPTAVLEELGRVEALADAFDREVWLRNECLRGLYWSLRRPSGWESN